MNESLSRTCLSCSKTIKGRSDKKFCNDYCRNAHNNQLRACNEGIVREINHALFKNRKIIKQLLDDRNGTSKTKKEALLQKGFQFRYYTHQIPTKKGILFYCYDHGYHVLNTEECLLLRDPCFKG